MRQLVTHSRPAPTIKVAFGRAQPLIAGHGPQLALIEAPASWSLALFLPDGRLVAKPTLPDPAEVYELRLVVPHGELRWNRHLARSTLHQLQPSDSDADADAPPIPVRETLRHYQLRGTVTRHVRDDVVERDWTRLDGGTGAPFDVPGTYHQTVALTTRQCLADTPAADRDPALTGNTEIIDELLDHLTDHPERE
jgi:hypothetical protein